MELLRDRRPAFPSRGQDARDLLRVVLWEAEHVGGRIEVAVGLAVSGDDQAVVLAGLKDARRQAQ